jgi:hypothetical protein
MIRIREVANDMVGTYQNPIDRRHRPQAGVSDDSGFVLILVLPVAMLLMMTALSLVTRSNSAAVASANESRAQAARMAAEYGLNQMMARVNAPTGRANLQALVGESITIDRLPNGSPASSYTIRTFNPPDPPDPLDPLDNPNRCPDFNAGNDNLVVRIEGELTENSGSTYTQVIDRTLRVCIPVGAATQLRVRAVR